MTFLLILTEIKPTLWDDLLPTLISVTVVMAVFLLGRASDVSLRKKQSKQTWYLDVIIKPNINYLGTFIKEFETTSFDIKKQLTQNTKTLAHEKFLLLKAQQFKRLSALRNKFEFDFLYLLRPNSFRSVYDKMYSLTFELEDKLKVTLDSGSGDNIVEMLTEYKINALDTLYKPLEDSKRFSFSPNALKRFIMRLRKQ